MRYYSFVFAANSKEIETAANRSKINIRQYDYNSTPAAVTAYMNRNIDNDICFFIYKEQADTMSAAFSYDERKYCCDDVYAAITDILKKNFSIKKFDRSPSEITGYDFFELVEEAQRRALTPTGVYRIKEIAKMEYLEEHTERLDRRFELQEKLIGDTLKKDLSLFDESVKNELANIEAHPNTSGFKGNMVHYFISSKSTQAASDITEAVVQRLIKANRLSGRRMEIFHNISPDLHLAAAAHHFEDIIENNFGGVVVIDLSVRLGKSPAEYGLACQYIEKVVSEHKNDCLFVFTYNTDEPGFAYELLRKVKKFIIPVSLKEGKGNRTAAVKYLKGLIKNSEYSQYAAQAGEYMKQFSDQSEFTQTDVLEAFENFGTWCVNKNFLNSAYQYGISDTFMLDRDEDSDNSYNQLQDLIGLKSVKEQIDRIVANDVIEKLRQKRAGKDYQPTSMHMIFSGNPGTAKTTVAKLFAGIAKEKGILKSGAFVCEPGNTLDFGNIDDAFKRAEGGVLFIDEAYAMLGELSITSLLQKMEECRNSVIVILAGYKDSMNEFLRRNAGLKSRIPYTVDFPDYSVDELVEIFQSMASQRGFKLEGSAVNKAREVFEKACRVDNFGNGRYVRNCLEKAIQNQSNRLFKNSKDLEKIRRADLMLIKGKDIEADKEKKDRTALSALNELDEMIGLASVKKIMHKVIAEAKIKRMCMDKGIKRDNQSMHMLFMGNPGTAKTTVARLFAQIMKEENILPTGNFVEVGRADLVGQYVGSTAPLVKSKFREARGGVLFIDEAYSLCDERKGSYGDEAINTIVQEMENHREDTIVIFAGYSEPMKEFVERNPGMNSRIRFKVNFEDYTADELCDITGLMLAKKEMHITEDAMKKLHGIYENARKDSDFGNGRFARQMIEDAEMNLAGRVVSLSENQITEELITTIEESDITDPIAAAGDVNKNIRRIGF